MSRLFKIGNSAALMTALAGCGVGSGTGHIAGDLTMLGCTENTDRLGAYDLGASFFAGEPFDDSSPAKTQNLLVVRIQATSTRPENADGVTFYISSTYEVARCVAGYVKPDGTPDWDPQQCDRSAGTARMPIGDGGQVIQATFTPFSTCPNAGLLDGYSALLSGVALGACDSTNASDQALNPVGCPAACPNHDSWIEFSTFGGASIENPARIGPQFIVDFGERIHAASLHLGLCDASVVQANIERRYQPPPRLNGTLDGWFTSTCAVAREPRLFPEPPGSGRRSRNAAKGAGDVGMTRSGGDRVSGWAARLDIAGPGL